MKNKMKFIPGLEINWKFYHDIVGPLFKKEIPKVKYAAGLIGNGSDRLGFDTPRSMDHNWGPRFVIVLPDDKFDSHSKLVDDVLRDKLPTEFMGYPTNFTDESAEGYLKRQMKPSSKGPVNHAFRIFSMRGFFDYYLGFDLGKFDPYKKMSVEDWLILPEHPLLEAVGGELYHDDIGFQKLRDKFHYYPHDVWLYIMGVQWGRISDEMSFHARTGEIEEDIGSRLLAANMVRHIMRMCFYHERKYAPYNKWFAKAFRHLSCSPKFLPVINTALTLKYWKSRQAALTHAIILLIEAHNKLKVTKRIKPQITDFHGRGYQTVELRDLYTELGKEIKDKKLKQIQYPIGSITQFVDHIRIHQIAGAHFAFKPIIK